MALTAGTRVGSYEIVSLIGEGGMGEVYRAHDAVLNRDVAVKVLPASIGDDADLLARFRREAQVLASLNHSSIATVHGFEESAGVRALIMELVDGETLAERIARGPIPLEDTLTIGKQIAEAFEAAHEQGIIHRDLKPANVKVREDGTVKVLDFGLAKALGQNPRPGSADPSNSPTLTGRATQGGMILGTAAYMSPEQARGKSVDRRADIWAFGVVLNEMLTGKRTFKGEDVSETLAAVLKDVPDFSTLPAATPRPLRRLIQRCLTRDPRTRLRDIGEARIVLEELINGATDPASPQASSSATIEASRSNWIRMLPWTIAAVAVVVAALAWLQPRERENSSRVVTRSRVELKDLSGFINVSRDGTKVVYEVAGGPRGLYLALRQMDQFEGKPIPGGDDAEYPVFSPDGQWIAYSRSKIRKIPIGGGAPIVLCDGNLANGGDWGLDDTIVFSGPQGLMRVSANGGTPQPLTTIDKTKGETAHVRPQFLPGGKQLLFTVTFKPNDRPQFAVLNLENGQYRIIAPGGDNGRYAASGHLTFVRTGSLFVVPFDLARLTVVGAEVPVIESVSDLGPPGTGDYAFSENGLLIYSEGLATQGSTLTWIDRKGSEQAIPGQSPHRWGTGRLSPDGLRVANGIHDEKGIDIWIMDLQRGTANRLTFEGQSDFPVWSPNGREVVYAHTTTDGKFGLYSVPVDGSAAPRLVLPTGQDAVPTSFTPDGKTLLYHQVDASGGRSQIFVFTPGVDAASRMPRLLRQSVASDRDAAVSPDGRWVAFTSNETGTSEIYVTSFPTAGGRTRVSTAGGRFPRWSHNGRELFFWGTTAGSVAVFSATVQTTPSFAAGTTVELFRVTSGTTWDPAPSGDRFLMENPRGAGVATAFVTVTDWFDEVRRRAPAKK